MDVVVRVTTRILRRLLEPHLAHRFRYRKSCLRIFKTSAKCVRDERGKHDCFEGHPAAAKAQPTVFLEFQERGLAMRRRALESCSGQGMAILRQVGATSKA
jgi:hypothetical protein